MNKIITYKASAGSGKTYNLTRKYLEMLFRDNSAYRNILAVTFTNKASEEMKGRIIRELYLISAGNENDERIKDIGTLYGIPAASVARKASVILANILNDYSRFSVGTIDRFFQFVIRNFAREAGLQASYNLELNNQPILQEAADNLLYEMENDESLRKWLIRYAENLIREGKTINLKKEIVNLGSEIFKESFNNLRSLYSDEEISDRKIREYSSVIQKSIWNFEAKMKDIGCRFLTEVKSHGLELCDFRNGQRSFVNYFLHITTPSKVKTYEISTTAREAIDNPCAWYVEKSQKKLKIQEAFPELNKLLREASDYIDGNLKIYTTANVIHRYIFSFGILNDLSIQVRQIVADRNLFLLSDASQFLNEIIGGNDAPFIYEKAGIYYKNFMLDEFQDTSMFQWKNFKPLISNSLSEGNENVIVGDTKQSIYRWRNSDWNILESDIDTAFPGYNVEVPLMENWRSSENVVEFNNMVFSAAIPLIKNAFIYGCDDEIIALGDKLSHVYKESRQTVAKKDTYGKGFVNLTFLKEGINRQDVYSGMEKRIPVLISELQDRGYRAEDIAILVRNGNHGKKIATILLNYKNNVPDPGSKYNFNVISNDSLYISGNPSVQVLVSLLRELTNTSDKINEAFLDHEFYRYISRENKIPDYHNVFKKEEDRDYPHLRSLLQSEISSVLQLSLFELVERLITIFKLNSNTDDIPYLQAFQDIILSFAKKETSDIASFLDYWDESGCAETMNIPEQQDAIRIMTIHKSKGLEFKVVIIPFCDWSIDHERTKTNILWCRTINTPFNSLPFVPLRYASNLGDTSFAGEYHNERLNAYIDNLNLLYVTLTRAENEIHVFSSPSANWKDKAPVHMGDLLIKIATENQAFFRFEKSGEDDIYSYGKKANQISECRSHACEYFNEYPSIPFSGKLKVKLISNEYFTSEPGNTGVVEYGIAMHGIISRLRNEDDLVKVVETAALTGKIDLLDKDDVICMFRNAFSCGYPTEIFDPAWTTFSERSILSSGNEYRPDRVMFRNTSAIVIDFKFGKEINNSYRRQVSDYMKLIRETGISDVRGYIWYLSIGKTEEVANDR